MVMRPPARRYASHSHLRNVQGAQTSSMFAPSATVSEAARRFYKYTPSPDPGRSSGQRVKTLTRDRLQRGNTVNTKGKEQRVEAPRFKGITGAQGGSLGRRTPKERLLAAERMGPGSRLLSQEHQRFKEFLPEIVPERAASSLPFPPTAYTFRLEVTPRRLRGELTAEIVSPSLRINHDLCVISPPASRPKLTPFPKHPESILLNVLPWLHEHAMNPTEPHHHCLTSGE
ncbi:hypothetical protein COCON_G00108930 [Conger conger]|uniref:Uncharacterized protein n=1 Tax=Conger conger TaxID=82655 RepID=A0A9Q1DJA4_CONCO|nr:hypothetical protein COCON_G00108930 [Conger conger]